MLAVLGVVRLFCRLLHLWLLGLLSGLLSFFLFFLSKIRFYFFF